MSKRLLLPLPLALLLLTRCGGGDETRGTGGIEGTGGDGGGWAGGTAGGPIGGGGGDGGGRAGGTAGGPIGGGGADGGAGGTAGGPIGGGRAGGAAGGAAGSGCTFGPDDCERGVDGAFVCGRQGISVVEMASDALYVLDGETLSRIDKAGPAAGTPVAIRTFQGDDFPSRLLLDGDYFYTTVFVGGSLDGQVRRWPRDGSGPSVDLLPGPTSGLGAIAVDDQFLYWHDSDGSIRRVPKEPNMSVLPVVVTGGPGLAEYGIERIGVDDTYVYWPIGRALKDQGCSYSPPAQGGAGTAGGGGTGGTTGGWAGGAGAPCDAPRGELLAQPEHPRSFTMDQDYFYWADWSSSLPGYEWAVQKVSRSGGVPVDVFRATAGITSSLSFAVDAQSFYFGQTNVVPMPYRSLSELELIRLPKTGGQPTVLYRFQSPSLLSGSDVMIDDTHVYWVVTKGCKVRILRFPK